MKTIDYSPLDSGVSFAQRFEAVSKAEIISMVMFVLVFFGLAIGFSVGRLNSILIWLFFGGVMVAILIATTYVKAGKVVRMRRFSEANQMQYSSDVRYDGRPGLIFQQGHSKKFLDLLSTEPDGAWEIGNYRYKTGSGKNQRTHSYGFVRIQLPRRLPHMLLDSRKNNLLGGRLSNLPTGLDKSQRLSLEGDFDKYFTLYAPVEYRRDALYIFTPDVMAAMIDSVQSYDCEVIDDSFYIYSDVSLKIDDSQQLKEIINIIRQLKPELTDQSDYYADERINDRALNIVAEPGARLKSGLSITTKIVVAIFFIYFLWMFFGPAIFEALSP